MKTEFDEIHLECPCKKSSDGYARNKDGSGKCFSCGEFFPSKGDKKDLTNKNITYKPYPHRGLSEATLKFFNILTEFHDDDPMITGFVYPNKSVKCRLLNEKKFFSKGPMSEPSLFGMDKFDPGSKDSITITEGEYDAPSVYQMTRGQTAVVSVRNAAVALQDCVANFEYLNSFKKIILALDNDEPGQRAAKQISSLFDFNKVYHCKFHRHKDANDYLQANEGEEFFKTWQNARRYSPDNIISTFAEIEKALSVSKEDQLGTYPFNAINEATYGLHEGEVIVVKAPRGVGKTEFFRALEHHLLKTTKHNLALIHLEEDNKTTIKAIAGYELNLPAVLPNSHLSVDDIMKGYKMAVNEDDQRLHLYSSFELEDENLFLNNIRFLVAGAGCRFVFLDHITWLATGMDDNDERKKLDRLTQRLKLLAKELKFCLVMISHVNANGATRGSMNIENVANTILTLSRDAVNPDPNVKRLTFFVLEKVRLGGNTGPAGRAIMDVYTGKLRELTPEDEVKIPVV